MATTRAVNSDAEFCRDCGGRTVREKGFMWCKNTKPQQHCRNLRRDNRERCEYCGKPPGFPVCQVCKKPAGKP